MTTPRTIEILDSLLSQAEKGNAPKTFHTPERYQVLGMLFNALRVDLVGIIGREKLMGPEGECVRNGFALLEMGMVPKEFHPYFQSGKESFLADVADITSGKMSPHD